MKVFVPFTEVLMEAYGGSLGELVPYQHDYQCFPVELSQGENPAPGSDPDFWRQAQPETH